MALRGSLKDFGLPDVFQLVQLSRKSGILRINGPGAEGSIWFRDGDVFFAQSNWRRELLGQRLVAGQKITPSALARALEMRGAEPPGGRRLGQILIDEGYITQQILEAFVQEQIQDTIFDIMRWDEGEFDFEVLPEVIQEDIGLSVSVENIVMEGSRRLEEWDRIRKRVPSTDMVFRMSTAPGEGTFEISLKPSEWNLLLLTDGTRSVRDLAVATRHTDFEVARTIYGLFSAGLLEVAADAEVEERRADRARREKTRLGRGVARMVHGREPGAEASGVAPAVQRVPTEMPGHELQPPPAGAAGIVAAVTGAAEVERRDVEVPEFLSRGGEEPSVEDLATFEQVLEAVLAQAEAAPSAEAEAAVVEVEVPAVDAGAAATEPTPAAVAEAVASEGTLEVPEVAGGIAAEATAPVAAETEALRPERPAGEVVRTGDFESDLLRLGLGEYPQELREQAERATPEGLPVAEAEAAELAGGAEPVSEYVAPEEGEAEESVEPIEPPATPSAEGLVAGSTPAGGAEVALEPATEEGPGEWSLPEGAAEEVPGLPLEGAREEAVEEAHRETPEEPHLVAGGPHEEVSAERAEVFTGETGEGTVVSVETPGAPKVPSEQPVVEGVFLHEQAAPEGELQEREVEAESAVVTAPELVVQAAADARHEGPAEEDVTAKQPPTGVVFPTAAFGAEVGLGGGLGDELTALTGGGGGRTRPIATVDRVPQREESVTLHRDMMVDRDLLLQIIDGVERL